MPPEGGLSHPTIAARGARSRLSRLFERAIPHAALAFWLPLVVYGVVYLIDGAGTRPSGDGFYSWIYARSLAFDGDLDFTNDYALCGDPFKMGQDRGGGRPDNPFYLGPAVVWTPLLFVARLVATVIHGTDGAARASCNGWVPGVTIALGIVAGALSVYLAFCAAQRFASSGASLVTALTFAFASPLFAYSTGAAHYSHVYLTAIYAALLLIGMKLVEASVIPKRLALLAAALVAVAALHRLNATICVLVPLCSLIGAVPSAARRTVIARAALVAAGAIVGVAATAGLYVLFYRTPFAMPHGPYLLQPAHAHPWLLLFGVHGGFFFWMPLSYAAFVGAIIAWKRRRYRWLLASCVVVAVGDIYVASMPLDWDAAWTIGARRLLPLWPSVVVLSAPVVDMLGRLLDRSYVRVSSLLARPGRGSSDPRSGLTLRAREVLAGGCIAYALVNGAPSATLYRGDEAYRQEVVYGLGSSSLWRFVDDHVGDIALLPAEAAFAWRFGLPVSAYREALKHRYHRRYRTLVFKNATIDFADGWVQTLSTGLAPAAGGARLTRPEARLVFTAEWPYATRVVIRARSDRAVTLRLARRTLFGEVPYGTVALPAGGETHVAALAVPPGGFDSGLMEWVVRVASGTDGDAPAHADGVVIEKISIEDERVLAPLVGPDPADP